MRLLLCILIPSFTLAKNVFVSSPFDNFRIECPKRSGATELSVRMVESVGAKRQDIVFDMSCDSIEEMYPWVNIPVGIAEMEREDCYYSPMFDPILDEQTEFTCKNREYFAGITRLTDTRVQILCCRLRSRAEFNCRETQFNKPIGLSRSSIIESDNQLINAIKVTDRGYTVRFCDLAPRNIPDIYEDVKTTTERPSTTPKESVKIVKSTKAPYNPYTTTVTVTRPTTTAPIAVNKIAFQPMQAPMEDLQSIENIENVAVPEYTPTKHPQMARINQAAPVTSAPTTESPTTTSTAATTTTTAPTTTTTASTTTTTTTTPAPTTTTEATTTSTTTTTTTPVPTTASTTTERTTTTEIVMERPAEVEAEPVSGDATVQEQPEPAVAEPAPTAKPKTSSVEDITMVDDLSRVTFNNDDFPKPNQKKLAVPGKLKFAKNQLPLRPGASMDGEFVFLPPINREGVRRAPVRTFRPHINLWSEEDDEMEEMYGRMGFSSVEKADVRRKVTRAHRLPAENKEMSEVSKENYYDNVLKNVIPDRETLYVKEDSPSTSTARSESPAPKTAAGLPEKVDNARNVDEETMSSPFEHEETASETHTTRPSSVYDRVQFQEDEDIEEVINRLSLQHGNIRRAPVRNTAPAEALSEKNERRSENDGKIKDGVKTQEGLRPIPIEDLVIFESKYKDKESPKPQDDLVPMMSSKFFGSDSPKSEKTTPVVTTSTASTTTTTVYDPSTFYHTPRPRPPKKEKVLTFCTKDIAIRDERNMVIACGGELDVWVPSRCPQGTDCFVSSDSTYRICCPVSRG